ncbi:MAG: hypothetical protein IPN88_02215 [Bacteroidetes bacterium]|nr:hypothetical protein [Bacteroidota bacterium]
MAKTADIFYPFIRQLKLTAMKTLAILFTTAKTDGNKGRVTIGFSQKSEVTKNLLQDRPTHTKIIKIPKS